MGIHERQYYRNLKEDEIFARLSCEGHTPSRVVDAPGTVYDSHMNSYDLVLAFIKGSAEIKIGDTVYPCIAGDKLNIPGSRPHSAVVGQYGVVYYVTQTVNCSD